MDNELQQKIERLEAQVDALTSDRIPKVDRASKRRDRRQVVAGFGLFAVAIMIAGTMSASALSGSNTVLSDDIKDGTITSSDIKADSILGSRVRNNALTGADVNESTLALACPSGTSRVADICYGAGPQNGAGREPKNFVDALNDCLDENLRLPSISEARLVAIAKGITFGLWTDVWYDDGGVQEVTIVTNTVVATDTAAHGRNYACVTTVGSRP